MLTNWLFPHVRPLHLQSGAIDGGMADMTLATKGINTRCPSVSIIPNALNPTAGGSWPACRYEDEYRMQPERRVG
jgi:hypothetical protein